MDAFAEAYRIDRLTAEFIFPETEQRFREYIKDRWVADTRRAIFLSALFYLMFAVTDYLLMAGNADYWLVLINRVFVCAVGLTAVALSRRHWPHLVNGAMPTGVVSLAMIGFIANVPLVPLEYGVQGMGMMCMLLGVYTFIPNRYIAAVSVSIPASLAYLMVVMGHYGLPLGDMATLVATLLVINILGAMVSWRTNLSQREAYCDQAVLQAANDRLEREAEERRRLEGVLRYRADHDETTGVANRAALFDAAARMIGAAEAEQKPFSLLLLDIDYFKQVSGAYGHMRGDEVLRTLVSVCQSVLAPAHYLGRLGGEEFVALLPETALPEAHRLAERLRQECQRTPVAIAEVAVNFTVCVGVVQRRSGETLSVMLRRADEAVSAAKYKGRNRVELAT